jgi:3-dehydroquinate synthase
MSDVEVRSSRGIYCVRFVRAEAVEAGPREHVVADAVLTGDLLGDAALAEKHALPSDAIRVEAGELLKSLTAVEALAEALLARGARRGDRLVAVGGATVSDVVGFLAGTLMRGMRWRAVPTTLLAQADACVGGKTGVNVGANKNALGTITPPDEVIIDVTWLRSLDDVSWRSGIAEVLKAHALEGPLHFDALARRLELLRDDDNALEQAIRKALLVKKAYVEDDEHDEGPRRLLNYGHTFGHAIEVVSDWQVPHGLAVALGMRIANHLAVTMDLLDPVREEKMAECLEPLTRDVTPPDADGVVEALSRDKKRRGDGHRFIVLGGGAHATPAEIRVPDGDARVREAVHAVLAQTRR